MNNAMFDPAVEINFEAPDMLILKQARTACSEQMVNISYAHTQTQYLPHLYNTFNTLNLAMHRAQQELVASAQRLATDIKIKSKSLQNLQRELDQASDDEHEEVLKDMSSVLKANAGTVGQDIARLSLLINTVNETFNRTTTMAYLTEFNIEKERLAVETEELESKRQVLDGERAVLTNAIKALESKGFADIANDTALNAQMLAALGATAPQLAVIQAALDLLQKSLESLDTALTFFGLTSLRDSVVARIDALLQLKHVKQNDVRQLNMRINMLDAIHIFDKQRSIYVEEYSKVITTLTSFRDKYRNVTDGVADAVGPFIADGAKLISYLKPVR